MSDFEHSGSPIRGQLSDNDADANSTTSEADDAEGVTPVKPVKPVCWNDQGSQDGTPVAPASTSGASCPTLAAWAKAAAAAPLQSAEEEAAKCVTKWAGKFATKGAALAALERLQVVLAPEPVAFAYFDTSDYLIRVIHSVGRITLADPDMEGNDAIIGFRGVASNASFASRVSCVFRLH
jgi:hypothetical protein